MTDEDVENALLERGFERTLYTNAAGRYWLHSETKKHIIVPQSDNGRYPQEVVDELHLAIGKITPGLLSYGPSRWNIGDSNIHKQRFVEEMPIFDTNRGRTWVLRCSECDHRYAASAFDFSHRRCPQCQGGPDGHYVG